MAFCCLCERAVDRWLPHPEQAHRSPFMTMMETIGSDLSIYLCPHCHSTDRDRHLWMYMNAAGLPEQLRGANILHIAPEAALETRLQALGPARYVRGDLHPRKPGHMELDAAALPFGDAQFELIIANHVLEHVADPARVLTEFHRCLAPGGALIAQTPYAPYLLHTLELNVPAAPEFARLFYGQEDHVRLFGADIARYFNAAGLEGRLLPHDHALADMDGQEFGCNVREPFFAFWRAQLPVDADAEAEALPA